MNQMIEQKGRMIVDMARNLIRKMSRSNGKRSSQEGNLVLDSEEDLFLKNLWGKLTD